MEIIFLYDDHAAINKSHSNSIYAAIANLDKKKDILLVLLSDGGKIEPAFESVQKEKYALRWCYKRRHAN